MVRIAVAGARGRMGGRISALSPEYPEIELAGAFEQAGHADIGRDVGELMGTGRSGLKLAGSVREVLDFTDVLVDFTTPDSALSNLKAASEAGKGMVIGTTGFTKEGLAQLRAYANKVPCVFSYNMSLGVNLLFKVLGDIARALGDD
jgi:4-hydroxy-tetrahydrodipicolinate reductase